MAILNLGSEDKSDPPEDASWLTPLIKLTEEVQVVFEWFTCNRLELKHSGTTGCSMICYIGLKKKVGSF